MNFMYSLHHNYIFTTNRLVVDPHSSQLSLVVILLLLKHNPFNYTYSSTVIQLKYNFFFQRFHFPLSVSVVDYAMVFVSTALLRLLWEIWSEKKRIILPWSLYLKRVLPTGRLSVNCRSFFLLILLKMNG